MAATYSNYEQAMRRWVDISMHPQWQSASSALAPLVQVPEGARLWYDHRNIPALQQNAKAAADIMLVKAQALVELVRAGYDPAASLKYVDSGEGLAALPHTGDVYFPGNPNQQPNVEPAPEPARSLHAVRDEHGFLTAFEERADVAG